MPTLAPPPIPETPGLTWRPLSEADFGPWHELVARIQDHDEEHERARMADLETMAQQSWVDISADCIGAVDADGVMRAVGRDAFRPGSPDVLAVNLVGGVDPQWRGRGVGRALLEWQLARALQIIAALRTSTPSAAELPARIGAFTEVQVTSRSRLLEASGFHATRWFSELRRPLAPGVPGPPPLTDPALRVELFNDALSERMRLAHNEAFADHWGYNAHDVESWRTNLIDDDAFRPDCSFVVVDTSQPDEPVVAYVYNTEFTEDWVAQGFSEGYTELLGVRRGWRKRGLATHLLELSAAVFSAAGHPYASLGVDTDNPTGALGLYRSLGYEPAHASTYYSIDV